MCGSVRGVGAGGIISTPFCILYKLYTLKLTRKQVNGLIRHKDSPFIRGIGFLFIRYTQPPQDLWKWLEPYLSDTEAIDPKAGGGAPMTIGEMVHYLLTKPDWFSTLFPRIPIPTQKEIEEKLNEYEGNGNVLQVANLDNDNYGQNNHNKRNENGKSSDSYYRNRNEGSNNNNRYSKNGYQRRSRSRSPPKRSKYGDGDRGKHNRYYWNIIVIIQTAYSLSFQY